MRSISALVATAIVAGTIGFYAGSAARTHAAAPAETTPLEELEAGFMATVMALSSLAVDTEINARGIAEMEGRLARMERMLASGTSR
ncbi:hypothetical protein NUH88_14195 [Nisaea acidiphila]|uniref:Uncharacterized protein n=1 Tax=Nisaea acidiphila TaxID=1862145 RepID=A0A9J7AM63_9PROT|nr:hypothetical protein [Nisaea acidiphila]UUX48560.1 hypothetical protein NUH88_14195 [Nisaea acidiphila]